MIITHELSVVVVNVYNEHKAKGITHLPISTVGKKAMNSLYKKFINEEVLTPIEQLSEEEKKELVQECRSTGLKYTNETLIEHSKILHLIKTINDYS